ncbi:MAG: patatin-like phospholipase family protein, partial [Proteobacteria bacterium]|nr:patatin-like phospholipase family protein [Pseudomonadota bacterium]
TGKARIFTREELTIEALLASACLPNVHDAVVIDGVPYWDGGFRGNPPIWPFIYACDSRDVVVVELDPSFRPGIPKTNAEVADRLNEITFGGALMAEMRAIAFVQELVGRGAISGEFGTRLKAIMIHSINDEASIAPMGSVSKFLIEPAYLEHLFQLGRLAAAKWLAATFDDIGVKSSVDIHARFL